MSKNPPSILRMGVYLYKKLYNEISHNKVRYNMRSLITFYKKIGPDDFVDER